LSDVGAASGPNTQPSGAAPRPARRALVIGCLRGAVGIGLIMAPKAVARSQADQSPTGTSVLLMRTIGVRDLVLGAGTVAAARAGEDEVRRWIATGLLSDALDVLTGAVSGSLVGRKGALTAAVVPMPFVLADLLVLRRLRSGDAPEQRV
jgi:hypothetical protein